MTSNVVRFPPLPPVPTPPSFPVDPRQQGAARIFARLGSALEGADLVASTANLSSGFPAASVDLARLKDALEAGLAGFNAEQLAARWEVDVRDWVHSVLFRWVQRCKQITARLAPNGIAIELQSQDDRGYYTYRFDVFPGR
jgi:hypothetical protein